MVALPAPNVFAIRPPAAHLRAALDLASRGLPVFPCNPTVKKGISKSPLTDNGFYDASTDEAVIRKWWARWPGALIGVPMGPASGCFAIDIDAPETTDEPNGPEAWLALTAEHGEVPSTHAHVTPSGGNHLLFRWRDDRDVTNKEGALKGKGINIRGRGGYVIFPPSALTDGRAYRMADPDQFINFADAPEWLFDMILQPEPAPARREVASGLPAHGDGYAMVALEGECRLSPRPGRADETFNSINRPSKSAVIWTPATLMQAWPRIGFTRLRRNAVSSGTKAAALRWGRSRAG